MPLNRDSVQPCDTGASTLYSICVSSAADPISGAGLAPQSIPSHGVDSASQACMNLISHPAHSGASSADSTGVVSTHLFTCSSTPYATQPDLVSRAPAGGVGRAAFQSARDDIFSRDYRTKFEFNESVVNVFDDMIERSVPFYKEVMDLTIYFVIMNVKPDDLVLDLGCSTGNFLIELDYRLKAKSMRARLRGIDSSSYMIDRASAKSASLGADIAFTCGDLLSAEFDTSRFVVSHYTMQFIRPLRRVCAARKVYESLERGGVFFMAEKTISHDNVFEPQMTECYCDYKGGRGYTHSEIYKKREALEHVLVPFSIDENIEMLREVGFSSVEILFKWVNFALFMARK